MQTRIRFNEYLLLKFLVVMPVCKSIMFDMHRNLHSVTEVNCDFLRHKCCQILRHDNLYRSEVVASEHRNYIQECFLHLDSIEKSRYKCGHLQNQGDLT